jgi:hypothetical protein
MDNSYDIALKIITGSILEIIKDANYAYTSASSEKYFELKPRGREAILCAVEAALPLLVKGRNEQLKEEAERLMMKKLSE